MQSHIEICCLCIKGGDLPTEKQGKGWLLKFLQNESLAEVRKALSDTLYWEVGRRAGTRCFHNLYTLSGLYYGLFHLLFLLLILCQVILHHLRPFTVSPTDKALSLALQEHTAMIDTRKNQSNLNVFPTEEDLLDFLLLMTYSVWEEKERT